MDKLGTSSQEVRRARTRSLIMLGALVDRAGLLETFGIVLGEDLQKSPEQKFPVAALYKGLVELNTIANTEDVHKLVWAHQGLQLLGEANRKKD